MRICTVCTHPQRAEIDKALASAECVKRHTAARYGLQPSSVCRHARRHLDPRLIEAYAKTVEAQDTKAALTARQVVFDLVIDLRSIADTMKANGKVVFAGEFLEVADRLVRANEQYGKITKEIGADQVNAMFVNLGVRSEDELRNRLQLSRGGEDLTPEQAQSEALETLRLCWLKRPELRQNAALEMQRWSFAEEVPALTNGTNGHQES